jgi:hypothetical protein
MAVDYNSLINDDGSNTVGTLIDVAQLKLLIAGPVVATTSTGAQNNWAPGVAGNTFFEWNGASDAAVTGLAGGAAGLTVMIRNITAAKVITFAHLSGSSSAANQFTNSATSGVTPVAPGGWIIYRHDGTNWQLVGHEQGAWITAAYVAGHFTGNGAMTWTVDAGDVSQIRYRLGAKTLLFAFNFATTTIAGTPNTLLQVSNAQWGGFTIAATVMNAMAFANDGAVRAAYSRASASGTVIELTTTAATAWSAVVNAGYFAGEIAFEVT